MCENYKNLQYKIRKLNEMDYNSNYINLILQTVGGNEPTIDKKIYMDFLLGLNEDNVVVIIETVHDKHVVGTINIIIENKIALNGNKHARLEDIIVDAEYRCYGIGKKLLDFAEDYCKYRGCSQIVADCCSHNIKFLEKCGFISAGTRMIHNS